ncbi:MAG: methionine ABC transporter ATP-binding protein, partial [Selenomonadaceae bacterium]|nr:methionine ABC transporter ATP-binding protein [Selenomonadaceae bacterium]
FIVGLSGSEDDIQKALNFLSGKEVRVEVIGYVRRNNFAVD